MNEETMTPGTTGMIVNSGMKADLLSAAKWAKFLHIVYARRFGTRQLPQAVLLERRIVIVVQVINAYNRPFCHLTQQPTHKVAPNEPGMSGYKYSSHILLLLI